MVSQQAKIDLEGIWTLKQNIDCDGNVCEYVPILLIIYLFLLQIFLFIKRDAMFAFLISTNNTWWPA